MQLDLNKLICAIEDYRYLLERNYPDKGVLKWVGDRYKLSSLERTLLYRGITTRDQAKRFSTRLVGKPEGPLIVDGYNVLFTLLNYRLGYPVFISTDHLCRDAGSQFGKITNEEVFEECCSTLLTYSGKLNLVQIIIYLDKPVTNSTSHLNILQKLALQACPECQVKLVDSADESLVKHKSGVLATSDSSILSQSSNPIFDLPHTIIEQFYNGSILDLETIV
jgi:hypothetical protein